MENINQIHEMSKKLLQSNKLSHSETEIPEESHSLNLANSLPDACYHPADECPASVAAAAEGDGREALHQGGPHFNGDEWLEGQEERCEKVVGVPPTGALAGLNGPFGAWAGPGGPVGAGSQSRGP